LKATVVPGKCSLKKCIAVWHTAEVDDAAALLTGFIGGIKP